MARTLSKAADEADKEGHGKPGHNRPELTAEAIQEYAAAMGGFEKRLKVVHEEKKEFRDNFKAKFGVPLVDLDAARRLARIEKDEERKEKARTFIVAYKALAPGEQGDLLEALQDA